MRRWLRLGGGSCGKSPIGALVTDLVVQSTEKPITTPGDRVPEILSDEYIVPAPFPFRPLSRFVTPLPSSISGREDGAPVFGMTHGYFRFRARERGACLS